MTTAEQLKQVEAAMVLTSKLFNQLASLRQDLQEQIHLDAERITAEAIEKARH